MADHKWGHYKTTIICLYCLLSTATVMSALGGALITIVIKNADSQTLNIGLGVPITVAFLLSLPSLIIFRANVLQFGEDQLDDPSSGYITVYIY